MSAERQERLKEILLAAVPLRGPERSGFLDRACGQDGPLRAEVESLLAHEAPSAGGERPGSGLLGEGPGRDDAAPPPTVPERIGPYRILGVLGEGGMGVVYRAEQTGPLRREVALKVLRDALRSEAARARFDVERRTLALMDHPGIAKVLDAGSDETGRPFFAMEQVRGEPITRYCASSGLDVRRRLDLFVQVCRAVRHAHRRGVIHRDLKPANVLVVREQAEAVPKVIDFGIAKAVDEPLLERDYRTRTGQIVGTLEYMSPEQARGDVAAVDTRSDVYSLGVILFELLAGRRPQDLEGQPLHEAVRRICEEPPRPLRLAGTTASGRVDADLSTIVAKCLEKEPDLRYGGAAELTEDLERYLDSRPILARPPSAAYLARKLLARHRVPFGFAALGLAFLVVYVVTVSAQLRVQTRERGRAEAEARKAERVTAFLQEMLVSASPAMMGRDVKVREVLDAAAAGIDKGFAEEPEIGAAVRDTMGRTYVSLGLHAEAEKLLRQALEVRLERLGPDHPETAASHRELANALFYQGRHPDAEREVRRALEIQRSRPQRDDLQVARSLNTLGLVLRAQGKGAEAVEVLRESLDLFRKAPGEEGPEEATVAENLAGALLSLNRFGEAEGLVRSSLEEKTRAVGRRNPGTITSLHNLAFTLAAQGKHAEALPMYREALALDAEVHGEKSAALVPTLRNLGDCLFALGRYEEAESELRRAAALSREVHGDDAPPHAGALASLARVLAERGRGEEAERLARRSAAIFGAKAGERHVQRAAALSSLAAALEARGRTDEAEAALREAHAIRSASFEEGHPVRARADLEIAAFLLRRGRSAEAGPHVEGALAAWRRTFGEDHPDYARSLAARAALLEAEGRPGEAEPLYRDALDRLRRAHGEEHPSAAQVLHDRSRCLRAIGRHGEALESARSALDVERRVFGETHPRVARSWLEAALSLAALGRGREASEAAAASLKAWEGCELRDPDAVERARALL